MYFTVASLIEIDLTRTIDNLMHYFGAILSLIL